LSIDFFVLKNEKFSKVKSYDYIHHIENLHVEYQPMHDSILSNFQNMYQFIIRISERIRIHTTNIYDQV